MTKFVALLVLLMLIGCASAQTHSLEKNLLTFPRVCATLDLNLDGLCAFNFYPWSKWNDPRTEKRRKQRLRERVRLWVEGPKRPYPPTQDARTTADRLPPGILAWV